MLEMITNWVKSLMMLVLFAAFLELILPSNTMKSFIRVVVGLLIMVAILNPMIDFFEKGFQIQSVPVFGKQIVDQSNINLADTKEKKDAVVYKIYKNELENQVRVTVESLRDVAAAKVEINLKPSSEEEKNKQIQHMIVFVKPKEQPDASIVSKVDLKVKKNEPQMELKTDLKNMILRTLCEMYQLQPKEIELRFWNEEIN